MSRSRIVAEGTAPKIYVASLSDYNAGSLCGEWFDLDAYADAEELLGAIHDMLKALDAEHGLEYGQPREEWAVHDYEGFPERFYAESMGFAKVYEWIAATATMSDERRQAYEAFIENGDEPEQFDDRYRGYYGGAHSYDDDRVATDYAEEQWHSYHDESEIPASLRSYIDWTSMGRDLMLSGEIWISNGHVFVSR
jgi:antirestriction protein